MFTGDLGFRVFKLDSTNIREWEPVQHDLSTSLQMAVDNLKFDRSENDVLFELLIRLGMDLCAPIEERLISGKKLYVIDDGLLIACLDESITSSDIEALGEAIAVWHEQLATIDDVVCIFRDSAFEDDVAKINLTSYLHDRGISSVRSI